MRRFDPAIADAITPEAVFAVIKQMESHLKARENKIGKAMGLTRDGGYKWPYTVGAKRYDVWKSAFYARAVASAIIELRRQGRIRLVGRGYEVV